MRHLIGVFLFLTILGAQAPKRAPAKPAHPDVGVVTGDCLGCHRAVTNELAADWEASKHGTRNVPCIACHGALGASFTRRPGAGQCLSCHSTMVDTLRAPHMKGKTCFSCHVPHRLNPHKSLTSVKTEGGK